MIKFLRLMLWAFLENVTQRVDAWDVNEGK